MNIFNRHIKYLKNNPKGYWFKRKLYGIGWTPASWQGWAVTGTFVVVVLFIVFRNDNLVTDEEVFREIIVPVIVLVLLFIVISCKTGEPLKWMWGKKSLEDEDFPKDN